MTRAVVLFSAALVASLGCAAAALVVGAERVIVSPQAPPNSCKFAGMIVGQQGGAFSGSWTSNRNLAQGALNELRNQALALGANYVLLVNTQAGQTLSGNAVSVSGRQTDVTHAGSAYRCPPADIGLD